MKSGILRCYIQTLKLRANAPFPSELARRQRYAMRVLRAGHLRHAKDRAK